jgi:hypothetical protein
MIHYNIIILQNGQLFRDQAAAARKIGAPGINLKNPGLSEYPRVFIRCNGPGYNIHIRKGTSVLYKVYPCSEYLLKFQ